MAVELKQRMTVEAFDAWVMLPENVEQHYEYIAGEAVAVVSHSYSSYIAAKLLLRVGGFIEANQLGYFTGADGGYQVGDERYIPDFGFISIQRQPRLPRDSYNRLAPDLAIEVVSPTDKERALRAKVTNYLAANTTVWVVYPDEKTVYIHRPGQAVKIVGADGVIADEPTLPGFTLAVGAIFPEE